MNEYTASNGLRLNLWQDCVGWEMTRLDYGTTVALREFFAAELGVWVDPETSALVMVDAKAGVPGRRYVSVFLDGTMYGAFERDCQGETRQGAIARRYFAAHPESKPWTEAKPGELWDVSTANQEDVRCFVVHDEPFSFVTADTTHHKPDSIIAAHRIYPPAEES